MLKNIAEILHLSLRVVLNENRCFYDWDHLLIHAKLLKPVPKNVVQHPIFVDPVATPPQLVATAAIALTPPQHVSS